MEGEEGRGRWNTYIIYRRVLGRLSLLPSKRKKEWSQKRSLMPWLACGTIQLSSRHWNSKWIILHCSMCIPLVPLLLFFSSFFYFYIPLLPRPPLSSFSFASYSFTDVAYSTLEHLSRISASDYVPIEEDVLAIHVETKAMEETVVQVQDIHFIIFSCHISSLSLFYIVYLISVLVFTPSSFFCFLFLSLAKRMVLWLSPGITYYLLDIPARPNMKKWGHVCDHPSSYSFPNSLLCSVLWEFQRSNVLCRCGCISYPASSLFPSSYPHIYLSLQYIMSMFWLMIRYDTKRDDGTNTLHHSLQLFNELRDATWVTRMDIILFFNKTDVFKDKITRIPLTVCFPEYTGIPLLSSLLTLSLFSPLSFWSSLPILTWPQASNPTLLLPYTFVIALFNSGIIMLMVIEEELYIHISHVPLILRTLKLSSIMFVRLQLELNTYVICNKTIRVLFRTYYSDLVIVSNLWTYINI